MKDSLLERKLDLLIYHLEQLPRRICDEMAIREEIRMNSEIERVKQELEFLNEHKRQINKMMFGCSESEYKVEENKCKF